MRGHTSASEKRNLPNEIYLRHGFLPAPFKALIAFGVGSHPFVLSVSSLLPRVEDKWFSQGVRGPGERFGWLSHEKIISRDSSIAIVFSCSCSLLRVLWVPASVRVEEVNPIKIAARTIAPGFLLAVVLVYTTYHRSTPLQWLHSQSGSPFEPATAIVWVCISITVIVFGVKCRSLRVCA